MKLEKLIDDIRFYADAVCMMIDSEDPNDKGALDYYKDKLDQSIKKYVESGHKAS